MGVCVSCDATGASTLPISRRLTQMGFNTERESTICACSTLFFFVYFRILPFLPQISAFQYLCDVQRSLTWPQDETWTDFDGPSWIQYDLFRKNKLPGSKNLNLAKFMLRAKTGEQLCNCLLHHDDNITIF